MSDPPASFENEGESPVTLAQLILTNKLYSDLIEEVTERLCAIRKICSSSIPSVDKNNPAYPMFVSIVRILDEDIDTNFFNIGDKDG
tara:strand:- start:808 stop:1068 length:261 start_codon:yes stop_codon:yes gene_type:complete